jgi:16S rRNA (cytosine967-C5)-methyltransferase
VTDEGAYSNLTIPAELSRARLSGRDRAFAQELAFGTLRRVVPIDVALGAVSTRPLRRTDPNVLAVLRLGAYQLLFTRVPPHAAVGETVGLAPPRSRGFVNAILRRLAVDPPAPPEGNGAEAVATRTGLSGWAVRELGRLLPPQEVEAAAAALATPAPLTIRTNRCRTDPGTLERAIRASGVATEPGVVHEDALRLPGASPRALPGFVEGWFAVQDEASMLVADALAVRAGERVLDACAAPGGKTAMLACAAGPEGFVVGADVQERRLRLAGTTFERLGAPVRLLVQDARRPAVTGGFDAVLVDAPCSGLGAARRRPELLWRPSPRDLARLARLQVAILAAAARLVKPGGRLVYSVCTFTRAETEAAVRAFLAKRTDMEPIDVPGPDGPAPTQRVWPHRHGTDAMFYAGFGRRRD